ncbi:MAG: M2 family metallopeptidase [Pseudomonadales bacterium]
MKLSRLFVVVALHCLLSVSAIATPTAEQAKEFLADAEQQLVELGEENARAAWIARNFINVDSQYVLSKIEGRASLLQVQFAKQAAQYDVVELPADARRKLNLLKQGITLPVPDDKKLADELATITSALQAAYGTGKYCPTKNNCMSLVKMEVAMGKEREPEKLLAMWRGWREVSPPMKSNYQREVEIANAGAKDLGYNDVGAMWRSGYDASPTEFAASADAQWQRIEPLYEALHCHVRAKLSEFYGADTVPLDEKIPAHLLGNMWAQQWSNIFDLVAPAAADPGYDLDELIEKKELSELDMVKTAEQFFVSLGLDPLPETFWERSLFTKPRDREVVCHASAWNLDSKDDLRIKMCIQKNADDFITIHHELGHNYYQRAYKDQPPLFRGSANDGFHEALGDTVALSITPDYLVEIGLLEKAPSVDKDIGQLLSQAMDKVAFIPFGLLVDKWRWQVFSGELSPDQYNSGWWKLREQYQGIEAPVKRTEADFDPGAKYHIPGNTPYMRYFLAHLQQFQFHKSLCETAGYKGPLHRCTIYKNKAAGKRLNAMMEMGRSRPWPDAMQALTGQRELDASALLEYFAPLQEWLNEQNEGRKCGW